MLFGRARPRPFVSVARGFDRSEKNGTRDRENCQEIVGSTKGEMRPHATHRKETDRRHTAVAPPPLKKTKEIARNLFLCFKCFLNDFEL